MSEAILVVVKETKHIPLADIEIGRSQFRTRNVMKGIKELAQNIQAIGLINAITVCEGENRKYELIAGQRRYLAHHHLGAETIRANILDRRLTEDEKRIISLSENITIIRPHRDDYIDSCTDLYRRYGTIQAVSLKLGLDYSTVSDKVHYDQLVQVLKDMVDKGIVNVKTAKRAQNAAITDAGNIDEEAAIVYAKEMRTMGSTGQRKMVKVAKESTTKDVAAIVEEGRKAEQLERVTITFGPIVMASLRSFALKEGAQVGDVASTLITEGLEERGYLQKDES